MKLFKEGDKNVAFPHWFYIHLDSHLRLPYIY